MLDKPAFEGQVPPIALIGEDAGEGRPANDRVTSLEQCDPGKLRVKRAQGRRAMQQLVYVSRSARPLFSMFEVSDILEQATRHNRVNDITGALAFTETHFVQILEGASSALDLLLTKLTTDGRHTDLEVLDRVGIVDRSFPDRAMISPRATPAGQRQLMQLLADDRRSMPRYRHLLLALCDDQKSATVDGCPQA